MDQCKGSEIAGCPVNGPALAARDGRIAAAWFTMGRNQRPRVLLAVSHDGGESFGKPEAIDSGSPMGRVDLVYAVGVNNWGGLARIELTVLDLRPAA